MIEDWKSYRYSKHAIRIYCSLLLGMIGIVASAATIYALPLEGASTLSCGIEKLSCSTALQSKFSNLFGIPLGIFGVFYFAFWILNLRAFQLTSNQGYLCSLFWITLLGAVGSSAVNLKKVDELAGEEKDQIKKLISDNEVNVTPTLLFLAAETLEQRHIHSGHQDLEPVLVVRNISDEL